MIDFRPVLEGELYGPLRNVAVFNAVALDHEAHTVVWPNGADFDLATLHDWPDYGVQLRAMARRWAAAGPFGRMPGQPRVAAPGTGASARFRRSTPALTFEEPLWQSPGAIRGAGGKEGVGDSARCEIPRR